MTRDQAMAILRRPWKRGRDIDREAASYYLLRQLLIEVVGRSLGGGR